MCGQKAFHNLIRFLLQLLVLASGGDAGEPIVDAFHEAVAAHEDSGGERGEVHQLRQLRGCAVRSSGCF